MTFFINIFLDRELRRNTIPGRGECHSLSTFFLIGNYAETPYLVGANGIRPLLHFV
ncbi:hypothetical protein [Okeania sp.]|uniref:hypothetical protein n=1 Tax=Okeania sp. TaxID=3100323 RepID=UPI002B4ACF85|nr:hypothetical protein [Okeania sp.]